jgi:hypothetical protein
MKTQIITLIGLTLFLISLNGVMAITSYCGDGICTVDMGYQESNPTLTTYCPLDCGIMTNEDWCHEEYNLVNIDDYSHCPESNCTACPTCPTCPYCGGSSCPTCSTSSIRSTDLDNWCISTGYSKNQVPFSVASSGTTEDNNKWIFWIIFLVVGLLVGYYFKGRRKKRR